MPWVTHVSQRAIDGALYFNTQSLEGAKQALPVHQIPFKRADPGKALFVEVDSRRHAGAPHLEVPRADGVGLAAHLRTNSPQVHHAK